VLLKWLPCRLIVIANNHRGSRDVSRARHGHGLPNRVAHRHSAARRGKVRDGNGGRPTDADAGRVYDGGVDRRRSTDADAGRPRDRGIDRRRIADRNRHGAVDVHRGRIANRDRYRAADAHRRRILDGRGNRIAVGILYRDRAKLRANRNGREQERRTDCSTDSKARAKHGPISLSGCGSGRIV